MEIFCLSLAFVMEKSILSRRCIRGCV